MSISENYPIPQARPQHATSDLESFLVITNDNEEKLALPHLSFGVPLTSPCDSISTMQCKSPNSTVSNQRRKDRQLAYRSRIKEFESQGMTDSMKQLLSKALHGKQQPLSDRPIPIPKVDQSSRTLSSLTYSDSCSGKCLNWRTMQ
jgi:hypothetical protein